MEQPNNGHRYELPNLEGGVQVLQFIEKAPVDSSVNSDGKLQTVTNGTTNEAVLTVLIERLQYLQAKMPCRENAIVITKLEEALMWLNKRTAGRVQKGIEGTNLVN